MGITNAGLIRPQTRSTAIDLPLVAAIFANLLWGISFLASKNTLVAWGPFTAAAIRFVLASFFVYVGAFVMGKKIELPRNASAWKSVGWVALTSFGLLYPLQLTGLQTIPSGLSAAIMLTSPLFVVIFDRIFLKEHIGPGKFVAIFFGILGGAILLSDGFNKTFIFSSWMTSGSGLTFLASISLAASVIQTRKLSASMNSANVTFWSMSLGALLLLLSSFLFEPNSHFASRDVNAWVSLLFLAVVCSAVCFFVWNYAVAHASPKKIASTMHLKTPTAVLVGALLLNEQISLSVIVGIAVVMAGVVLSQMSSLGRKK